jgi:hypothetical protein
LRGRGWHGIHQPEHRGAHYHATAIGISRGMVVAGLAPVSVN